MARHPELLALAACAGGVPAKAQRAEPATAPAVGSIQLVSATTAGSAATAGSTTCAVSADGHLVLSASEASNPVAGDSHRVSDLLLKILAAGATIRITTQSRGEQIAAGGNCLGTTMTPDGRVVAFHSGSAVVGRNRQTGLLTQASPPAAKVPQVTGFFGGVLSEDGSKRVFLTLPETTSVGAYLWVNVVPTRLMLRDLGSGSRVTLTTDNVIVGQGEVVSNRFAISPDGAKVAFVSPSASRVPGDTNARPGVFRRDLVSGRTMAVLSHSDSVPAVPVASGAASCREPNFVSHTQFAFGTGQRERWKFGQAVRPGVAGGLPALLQR